MRLSNLQRYSGHFPKLVLAILISMAALGADGGHIEGIVLDPSGAVIPSANILILGQNGRKVAEVTSDAEGKFEVTTPANKVTLVIAERDFERFKKEVNVAKGRTTEIEVKLSVGCSGDIEGLVPKKPDLNRFVAEIHSWEAFGICPEKVYRLWGTGDASISFQDCIGKRYEATRVVNQSEIARVLAKLAKENAGPVCSWYPGGIDAARTELTIFSGSAPSLVISHDAGDEINNVTPVEQELQKLIDPENRMQSFREQAIRERERRDVAQ